MLIGAYGEFWDSELVDWHPGSGPSQWRLLGRLGERMPGLQVTDFRRARGVYVLYDHHGAYYAGLARGAGGIGGRLKQHRTDVHADKWQRFSWYSFDSVGSRARKVDGLYPVERRDRPVPQRDESTIRELEALLITVLGTRGQRRMKFQAAKKWEQVPSWEHEQLLKRVIARGG